MIPTPRYSRFYFPELAAKMDARIAVDPITGCWNWTRGVNADGYGCGLYVDGRQTRAHRVAYMVANGYLPPRGVFVCHLCSNPACCRPEHLAAGNAWDNAQDTKAAGRTGRGRKSVRQLKADALVALMSSKGTHEALAEHLGISMSTVARHRRRAGIKTEAARRLTEGDVRAIRASEEPGKILATRYGVTASNVRAIRKRISWKHVD